METTAEERLLLRALRQLRALRHKDGRVSLSYTSATGIWTCRRYIDGEEWRVWRADSLREAIYGAFPEFVVTPAT